MDYEFTSIEELYKRVIPALNSKVNELKKIDGLDMTKEELWKCLIEGKWKTGNKLMLSDIVDDILNTSIDEINLYYEKILRAKDEEIL